MELIMGYIETHDPTYRFRTLIQKAFIKESKPGHSAESLLLKAVNEKDADDFKKGVDVFVQMGRKPPYGSSALRIPRGSGKSFPMITPLPKTAMTISLQTQEELEKQKGLENILYTLRDRLAEQHNQFLTRSFFNGGVTRGSRRRWLDSLMVHMHADYSPADMFGQVHYIDDASPSVEPIPNPWQVQLERFWSDSPNLDRGMGAASAGNVIDNGPMHSDIAMMMQLRENDAFDFGSFEGGEGVGVMPSVHGDRRQA